jgi:DNA-binding MarR family transcriptional regulator
MLYCISYIGEMAGQERVEGDGPVGATPSAPSGPPADAEDELVEAVLRASRALVGVAARSLASAEEVTLPQYRVLIELASAGPQRVADLAEALGVDPSTATRMCDRLVHKDLVQRRRISSDRRGVRISLTAAGRDLVEEVGGRRRQEIAAILGRMPGRDRQGVLAALRSFAEAAGELSDRDWWAAGELAERP